MKMLASSAIHVGSHKGTYAGWVVVGDEVARALDENVRPVVLLVNNPSELTIIAIPRCRRFPGKPLNSPESCVLGDHFNSPAPHGRMRAHT